MDASDNLVIALATFRSAKQQQLAHVWNPIKANKCVATVCSCAFFQAEVRPIPTKICLQQKNNLFKLHVSAAKASDVFVKLSKYVSMCFEIGFT